MQPVITEAAPVLTPETKSFRGGYLLFRRKGKSLLRGTGGKQQHKPPQFRHQTFGSAETEAQRLLGFFPESTFVIIQEVARVKLKPAEPKGPVDSDPAHVFEAHARWVQQNDPNPDEMPDATSFATTALDQVVPTGSEARG